ncbi:hypothetical protein CPB97_001344 [Podila verticillata]|nr:hypothetical protein CPB97_001344 [Podila verticillata]
MARLLFSCLLAALITLATANVSNTDQHPLAKPAHHKKFCLIWGNYPLKENQPFRLMAQVKHMYELVLARQDAHQTLYYGYGHNPTNICIVSSEDQECSRDTWLDCVEEWAEYRIRLESPTKSYLTVVDNQVQTTASYEEASLLSMHTVYSGISWRVQFRHLGVPNRERLFFTVDNYQSPVQLLPITAALDQEKASNYFYLIAE